MLALLLPAIAIAAPQDNPVSIVATDAEARWVDFELTPYNQIRFTLEIGGKPARAVLDTGLSDTIVTRRFADSIGLKPGRWIAAQAIGGSVPISWVPSPGLRFGGLSRAGGRIGVMRGDGEARVGADMLVGSDVLGCCALDLDFDNRRFRILRSGRMPFAGTSAPLSRLLRLGVYVSSVTIAGKRITPVIVDIGDGASLTLSQQSWSLLPRADLRVTTTIGWGMGGAAVTDTAIVPDLAFAGTATRESEVRVEPKSGFLDRAGMAGRVGTGLMMRFRVLLDPAAGHMIVAPGTLADQPLPRSTSGLLLEYKGGALEVAHVMRGSPAAESGWSAGDRICAADGVAIAQGIGADGIIGWAIGAPGRTVRLTLCSGAERRLTLRRFY